MHALRPLATRIRHATPLCDLDDEDEFNPAWWELKEDYYGEITGSERFAIYSLPLAYCIGGAIFLSLKDLFPNTPISWLTFFAIILAWNGYLGRDDA